MWQHPGFDPVLVQLGPVAIHWYGLMYLLAFLGFHALAKSSLPRHPQWDSAKLESLLNYGVLGVVLGGRLGYVLFYKPMDYLMAPWKVLAVWEGGMSFHGGLLGVVLALALFARRHQMHFLAVTDFVAPHVPLGLGLGRLGNFINAELWGRPTDGSWGMIFPRVDALPRHPWPLYAVLLEGVLLLLVLGWLSRRQGLNLGRVSGAFALGYGLVRFCSEFFRQPDTFLGLLLLNLSMGQWLSLPLIAVGAWLCLRDAKKPA